MEKSFFSKNLSTYLFVNKLTYGDVAEKLGITSQAVNKWISNTRPPQVNKLQQVANMMGLSMDDLVRKDMTYELIRTSGYSELTLTDGDGQKYGDPGGKTQGTVAHLRMIQDRLRGLMEENERFLAGFPG